MESLFGLDSSWLKLPLERAEVFYCPVFLSAEKSNSLYEVLLKKVPWHQETLTLFGKPQKTPRLMAWYGDEGADYRYSGVLHEPLSWLPELQELRTSLEEATGCQFNSVLLNYYRDGLDSMGWHSDDEPELGDNPLIVSLSIGAERKFRFRARDNQKNMISQSPVDQVLENGSLLLMGRGAQKYWQHSIPKTARCSSGRLNLTFRYIFTSL